MKIPCNYSVICNGEHLYKVWKDLLVSFCIIGLLRTLLVSKCAISGNRWKCAPITRLKTFFNIAGVGAISLSALDCQNYLITAQFPRPNSLSLCVFSNNDIAVSTQLNRNHRSTNTSVALHLSFETFIMPFRYNASAFENCYLIRNGIMHKNRSWGEDIIFANFF